jgi:UDP-glucuronate 4-epimerase
VYNIGNQRPVALTHYVEVLQHYLGRSARLQPLPLQPGDVVDTCADVEELVRDTGYQPRTTVEEGVKRFVEWYLEYYEGDRLASATSANVA